MITFKMKNKFYKIKYKNLNMKKSYYLSKISKKNKKFNKFIKNTMI